MTDNGSRGRALATLVTGWVVILGLMLLLGWLLTHPWQSSVGSWDDDVERRLAAARTDDLDRLASAGTFLGDTLVGLTSVAVVAVAVSVWQRSLRAVVLVAVLVVGALGLYLACTELISRDRPPVPILDPGLVPDHSFPSGHVITAVVLYGGTAVLVARAWPRTRPWIFLLALLPPAVALARLYQGAHHPTDVLTSLVFATAWLAVVRQALLRGPTRVGGHG